MNWALIIQIAEQALAVAPAVVQGVINEAPYVAALQKVLAGQEPTDADWAAIDAAEDAASAALQAAANAPDAGA
jgi:hypothetical protein